MRDRWKRDRLQRRDESLRDAVHGRARADELPALCEAADVVIDARGTFCPEPVIRVQEAARVMSAGQIALLEADDAGVEVDIPAWGLCTGNEFLGVVREESVYRVLIRKA